MHQRKTGPGVSPDRLFLTARLLSRALAPEAAAEAEEAEPGKHPSPESPYRPGTSASPEAAAEAAEAAVAVAAVAAPRRNCRSGSPAGCSSAGFH